MAESVLYIPNERERNGQRGPRRALASLQSSGLLKGVRVFSYLMRLNEASPAEVFSSLQRTVREFEPSIILLQHPAGTGLSKEHWTILREVAEFKLIYHEGDAYDRVRKRIPMEMRAAAAASDVSFSVGSSRQATYLRQAGARDVRWTPSVFNPYDFGRLPFQKNKRFDVVMIANESSSRLPFLSIPGSGARKKLARMLEKTFGSRFALFGSGWGDMRSARGPLPYLEQEAAIQSAWLTANWDHYPRETRSFSDRLPITLASGSVHVTSAHPGYDELFGDDLGFLHYEESPKQVVERLIDILDSNSTTDLQMMADQARKYAHAHFRQDDDIVRMLNAAGCCIDEARASEAWDSSTALLQEY